MKHRVMEKKEFMSWRELVAIQLEIKRPLYCIVTLARPERQKKTETDRGRGRERERESDAVVEQMQVTRIGKNHSTVTTFPMVLLFFSIRSFDGSFSLEYILMAAKMCDKGVK